MMRLQRRRFLQAFGSIPFLYALTGCQPAANAAEKNISNEDNDDSKTQPAEFPPSAEIANSKVFKVGYLSIIQGPTSDSESNINIFTPRLKAYTYSVTDDSGRTYDVKTYETVKGPAFYNIDKIKVTGLTPGVIYTLKVNDKTTLVDQRSFQSLNTSKADPVFAMVSCMADDFRFNEVIDPMWNRLQREDVDFLVLSGDQVYVDSFEFVERKKATEYDLWQRYIDSFRRIPLYHWAQLKPIFALWDDHDFGTNDGDNTFISKEAADRIFKAAFSGQDLTGVWSKSPQGTSSYLNGFKQKFFFMDDRSFRQPNSTAMAQETYGHWGKVNHDWLIAGLSADQNPAWVINGNQIFNGAKKTFIESLEQSNPTEFTLLMKQLRQIKAPVVFGSGDIHLTEVCKIPKEKMGYETFELTSSSMHSFVGAGWDNELRVAGAYCIEFNFCVVRSVNENGKLKINTKCLGLAKQPYFDMDFVVSKNV